jgi:hypothetical protein
MTCTESQFKVQSPWLQANLIQPRTVQAAGHLGCRIDGLGQAELRPIVAARDPDPVFFKQSPKAFDYDLCFWME